MNDHAVGPRLDPPVGRLVPERSDCWYCGRQDGEPYQKPFDDVPCVERAALASSCEHGCNGCDECTDYEDDGGRDAP